MSALDKILQKQWDEQTNIERCIVTVWNEQTGYEYTAEAAAAQLSELQDIKEAVWKLAERPTSEAKLRELLKLVGVEI